METGDELEETRRYSFHQGPQRAAWKSRESKTHKGD